MFYILFYDFVIYLFNYSFKFTGIILDNKPARHSSTQDSTRSQPYAKPSSSSVERRSSFTKTSTHVAAPDLNLEEEYLKEAKSSLISSSSAYDSSSSSMPFSSSVSGDKKSPQEKKEENENVKNNNNDDDDDDDSKWNLLD
eukprot:Awhi_evm1s6129